MTGGADLETSASRRTTPTAREAELLAVTLELVQECGYDRLTLDAVAARARASKATVYRRWPSKAELVVAAVAQGISAVAVPPNTGSLREDLLQLAQVITLQARRHATTIAGVLPELRRNPRLFRVLQREFHDRRKALVHSILRQAAERGEISASVISDEIWDVLPGYLMFRSLLPIREITDATLVALVDDLLLPSLTRDPPSGHHGPRP
jgi:AcrR family transcriptional regulator